MRRHVTQELTVTYCAAGRRWFTRDAAYEGVAKAILYDDLRSGFTFEQHLERVRHLAQELRAEDEAEAHNV